MFAVVVCVIKSFYRTRAMYVYGGEYYQYICEYIDRIYFNKLNIFLYLYNVY